MEIFFRFLNFKIFNVGEIFFAKIVGEILKEQQLFENAIECDY